MKGMVCRLGTIGIIIASIFCVENVDASTREIIVGVRTQAGPFSYKVNSSYYESDFNISGIEKTLTNQGYRGYTITICDAALHDLRKKSKTPISLKIVEVTSVTRFSSLLNGAIHVLCGASTISGNFLNESLSVSMPIYISGVSYAISSKSRQQKGAYCDSIVGAVSRTTTDRGLFEIVRSGKLSDRYRLLLEQTLDKDVEHISRADCPIKKGGNRELTHPYYFGSHHKKIAQRFCKGKLWYYVGDWEILDWNLRQISECVDYQISSRTFSDQRYGIYYNSSEVLGKEGEKVVVKFVSILNSLIYSEPSILVRAFAKNFGNRRMTPKLEYLYWSMIGPFK